MTGQGLHINLITSCPRSVQKAARRDCEQWLLEKARKSHGYMQGLRRNPYLQPLQVLANKKTNEQWGHKEQGILKAIVANGMWDQQRLFDTGRAEHNKCTICGDIGTTWHAAWDCPATATFRDGFGTTAAENSGQKKHPQWPLWSHGLIEDPRAWLPGPALLSTVFWTMAPEGGRFEVPAFGDGSGLYGEDPEMCRAG